jgi:hypothetical protein
MAFGLFIALAIIAAAGTVLAYLLVERLRAQHRLDTYARQPGGKPLTSFACPDCLHRTYAPQHVRDRFCIRCNKSFPKSEQDRMPA